MKIVNLVYLRMQAVVKDEKIYLSKFEIQQIHILVQSRFLHETRANVEVILKSKHTIASQLFQLNVIQINIVKSIDGQDFCEPIADMHYQLSNHSC